MNSAGADGWNDHWQQFGAAAEMGPSPKYRRRLVFRLLEGDKPRRMLELGSGMGEFAEEFCRRFPGSQFLGLELSHTGVEAASRRVPQGMFLQRDLLQPPSSDDGSTYAATHALCSEVLEHLDHPGTLLRNATLYMAPGCKMIVTVPGGPMNAFYRHIGHRRHYSSRELNRLLQSAGFEVERAYDAGFPFFNLFRLGLTLRGDRLINSISGPPSPIVSAAMTVFDWLFRLNVMRWGWQTIAVARYVPKAQSSPQFAFQGKGYDDGFIKEGE